jgi:hypothetical protein
MRAVSRLFSCTLASALQLRKNQEKTSVMVAEESQQNTIQLVDRAVVEGITAIFCF